MSNNTPIIKEADLKKTAEMLQSLNSQRNTLLKEAKAIELLYKQAEFGQSTLPSTYAELREKVAELTGKDLKIVEEAMKLASSSGMDSLGGLDSAVLAPSDPRKMFEQSIIGN